MQCEPKRFAA